MVENILPKTAVQPASLTQLPKAVSKTTAGELSFKAVFEANLNKGGELKFTGYLQDVWFSALVGWSAGFLSQPQVVEHMREVVEPLRRWAAGIGVDLECELPAAAVVHGSLALTLEALRTMVELGSQVILWITELRG